MRPSDDDIMRPTGEEERWNIKVACGRALRQYGAANFARETRVGEAQLSRYLSRAEKKDFMAVDIVADLERLIGYPLISEHLASMSGYSLQKLDGMADAPNMEDVGRLADAKGRLLSALIKALMDGHLDAAEKREILPMLDDTIAQLQDFRSGLTAGAT